MSAAPHLQIEQIALYLGKPWKVNRLRAPSNWSMEIIDGSGRGLYFRVDGQKFRISGTFPRCRARSHHEDYKTIGVSITRPAKDIAADITRRLLPHYLEAYDKAVIRYAQEQEREQRLHHIAQSLVTATGGRMAEYGRGARTVYFQHATAEIWSDETVTLNISSLSIERAIKIAAILSE